MDRVKFLEGRISELEERLQTTKTSTNMLDAVDFFKDKCSQVKVKDVLELARFSSSISGGVMLNLDILLDVTDSFSGKMLVKVNSTAVGEISFNASTTSNTLHFSGAVQCVKGVENILTIEITNLTGVSSMVVTKIEGVIFGMGLKNMRGENRLSAYKLGGKIVEMIVDSGKIYFFKGTAPAKSFGDFLYYADGVKADAIICNEDNTDTIFIARMDTNKNAFMSVGESVSTEKVVSNFGVSDVAIGKTTEGPAVFYVKNGQVYFRLFDGSKFLSEKLLSRENKRTMVEVCVVGENEELLVIARSDDGGNYLYSQVDVEKLFGGKNEKLTIKVTATVAEVS